MREILFKAKRTDNGEWVEGLYFKVPKDEFGARVICENGILPNYLKPHDYYRYYIIQNNTEDNSKLYGTIASDSHEIDLETLCQYTGIKDKDGNRIFENDIVQYNHRKYPELEYPHSEPVSIKPTKYKRNYKVEYVNTKFTYGLRLRNKSIHFLITKSSIDNHGAKIIGNIFDNPELLEEL